MNTARGYWVALIAVLILLVIALVSAGHFRPLAFNQNALTNFAVVLAPLVAVAGFIERAVEVILTPWRGDASDKSAREIKGVADPDAKAALEAQLHDYKLGTRRYAFLLSVTLGIIAALMGVRAIQNLVDTRLGALPQAFDVLLTGLLLGGGADGIHKPVKAFTDYMDLISQNSKAKTP